MLGARNAQENDRVGRSGGGGARPDFELGRSGERGRVQIIPDWDAPWRGSRPIIIIVIPNWDAQGRALRPNTELKRSGERNTS